LGFFGTAFSSLLRLMILFHVRNHDIDRSVRLSERSAASVTLEVREALVRFDVDATWAVMK
jgi:hypothetical protein